MAVFVIFFISVAMVGILELASTDFQILQNYKFSNRALYIAEAGIEEAIYRIRQNINWRRKSGNPLVVEFPAGSGDQFSVICPQKNPPKTITSTAILHNGYKRRLKVSVYAYGSSSPYTIVINYWKEI